ncbi:MAG: hypothetical protein ACYTFA_18445 [Planctomycetota bacterium]|jgi:hypothetical protein
MPGKLTVGDYLDREFLEIRRRLIDIAAALDRIDRADGSDDLRSDPRMETLRQAALVLNDGQGGRAERVQMVFSDTYDAAWRGGSTKNR